MTSKTDKALDPRPLVSIIMPIRNEELFIASSLQAILQQTYPKDRTEVIVADGMSTDKTREIIQNLAAGTKIAVTIVDNPKRIAPTGLNCGLAHARGDVIIRVDGHCEVAPDYVEKCVTLLLSGRADGVGGPIETIGQDQRSQAIALAMSSTFGVGGSAFRTINDREMYTDTVAFPAYTRDIIERAGAFNEELVRNQDDEYNYRIRERGGRILLSPTIRSRYYSRSTFRSLWRQYFQYGYWKVRVLQLHPRRMGLRHFVPATFVSVLIALAILSLFSWVGRAVLASLVIGYLIADLGAAISAAKKNLTLVPAVSFSFVMLHLSYGMGWLAGLIAFRSRWRKQVDLAVKEIGCA